MLYKLKDIGKGTLFVPLKATTMVDEGYLEKKMEQWLAENPSAVLPEGEERVLVFSQESPFENMTDVLAVDEAGNTVIIEVKRGQTPRDVIAQALEYAATVAEWDYETLNRKAVQYFKRQNIPHKSLLEGFCERFDVAAGDFLEEQFNQQQRIFVVGESISEKIERTARWLLNRGISISCLSYTCYSSDDIEKEVFLDIQEVVRPIERQGTLRQPRSLDPVPTEEEAVASLPDKLRKVYVELKSRVEKFGADVEASATRSNLIFKAGRNFAEIGLRSKTQTLRFLVRPEGYNIPEKGTAVVNGIVVTRVPDTHVWTLNHLFDVDEKTDLDAITKLLYQAYMGVSKKR